MKMQKAIRILLKPLILCLICSFTTVLTAQNAFSTYKNTMKVLENQTGNHCQNSNSLYLKLQNTGSQTMDVQIAVQNINGTWETREFLNISSGADTGDKIVICETNGHYKLYARPSTEANSMKFPEPYQLNK